MLKTVLMIIFIFAFTSFSYSKDYLGRPIHKDNIFSKITTPKEEEILTLLKGKETELNIILIYLKTLDFCKGNVSRVMFEKYTATLNSLPEKVADNIRTIENELIDTKKIKISIQDIDSDEHYLPIIFLNGEK